MSFSASRAQAPLRFHELLHSLTCEHLAQFLPYPALQSSNPQGFLPLPPPTFTVKEASIPTKMSFYLKVTYSKCFLEAILYLHNFPNKMHSKVKFGFASRTSVKHRGGCSA